MLASPRCFFAQTKVGVWELFFFLFLFKRRAAAVLKFSFSPCYCFQLLALLRAGLRSRTITSPYVKTSAAGCRSALRFTANLRVLGRGAQAVPFLAEVALKCICQEILAQCRRGFKYALCFLFPGLYICVCLFQDRARNQQENKTCRRLRPPHWCSEASGTPHHQFCSPASQEQIQAHKHHSAALGGRIPYIIPQIQKISVKSCNTAER